MARNLANSRLSGDVKRRHCADAEVIRANANRRNEAGFDERALKPVLICRSKPLLFLTSPSK